MIASVRTSRRTMFGGLILCVFSIIGLMVVKDMNDKLSVMTSSNSGYQRMTDSQTNRINQLNTELKNSKKSHQKDMDSLHRTESELKSKLAKSERQVKQLTPLSEQLPRVQSELETYKQKHDIEMQQAEEEHTRMLKLLAETRRDKESDQGECSEKIQKAAEDRDQCKVQYSNLLKEHQEATDNIQKLQRENKDLQKQIRLLQSRPSAASLVTPSSQSKPLGGHQIQIPQNNKQIMQPINGESEVTSKRRTSGSNAPLPVAAAPAAMSTPKSINANQNFLEEPKMVGRNPMVLNGRDNIRGGGNAPPVAAEPPLAKHAQAEFVPQFHKNSVMQEDVMEAPKKVQNGKKINYAQIHNPPSKFQPLDQPRKLNVGQNGHGIFHGENDMEDNEGNIGYRKAVYGRYSPDAQGLPILNLNRQVPQPLVLHPRAQHPINGENLDQLVDNVEQEHPELQSSLDTGRLHDKYLQEEAENQMDDDVDGHISNNRHHFLGENDDKVIFLS